jgi:hypothetical protein
VSSWASTRSALMPRSIVGGRAAPHPSAWDTGSSPPTSSGIAEGPHRHRLPSAIVRKGRQTAGQPLVFDDSFEEGGPSRVLRGQAVSSGVNEPGKPECAPQSTDHIRPCLRGHPVRRRVRVLQYSSQRLRTGLRHRGHHARHVGDPGDG